MTAAVITLNPAALVALAAAEQRIERGLKTFIDVGQALAEIRDSRLYKGTHDTFEAYCQERWQIDRTRAQNFITAARTVLEISNTHPDLPAPVKESQARALAAVPEPDRAEVWRETVERTEGKPTAAAVRAVQRERAPFPGPVGAVTAPPAVERTEGKPTAAAIRESAERRDARALLLRAVDLLAPVTRSPGFVDSWIRQLGPYDDELSDLIKRAGDAITVLDNLIEGAGQ